MSRDLNQSLVISNLNSYLKWNNLPIKMNNTGICNGLAMVHAKYVLEGKEQQFMDLVAYIANGIPKDVPTSAENKISSDELDFFIMEVFLAFSPAIYDQRLRQSNAMNTLQINGEYLKSSFDFAMVGSNTHWEQVIAELQLKKGEVLQVGSVNHAISVHKINDKYRVYDPNYSSGYKDFADEKKLISELHYNVFDYAKGNAGMRIHVIRHPEQLQQERIFPSATALYAKYLPDVNAYVTVKGKTHTTLTMTAKDSPDSEAIEYLLTRNAGHAYTAALNSIINNNHQALKPLLEHISDDSEKKTLFEKALHYGRQEAFDELVKHEKFGEFYQKKLLTIDLVIWAATGGNPVLLATCLEKLKTHMLSNISNTPELQEKMHRLTPEAQLIVKTILINDVDKRFAASLAKHNVMAYAVLSGDVRCVQFINQQLVAYGKPLENTERIRYLSEAIRRNKREVALELMDMPPKLEPESLQTIQMTVLATSRTNLLLLHDLRDHGMLFSEKATQVIAKKEHQALGIFAQLGIVISRYTDFIKEYFSDNKEKGVSISIETTKNMKGMLQALEQKPANAENSEAQENLDLERSSRNFTHN